jgi:hypothetical protein
MKHRSYIAAVLYGVIFILITAYLLLNILIAIVEEAYFLSRKKSRFLDYLMWKNLQTMMINQNSIDQIKLQEGMKNEAISKPVRDEDEEENNDSENDDEEDEWLQNVYSSIYTRNIPQVNPNDLHITLAEEAAEMYILGKSHWEYSKVRTFFYFLSKTLFELFCHR